MNIIEPRMTIERLVSADKLNRPDPEYPSKYELAVSTKKNSLNSYISARRKKPEAISY